MDVTYPRLNCGIMFLNEKSACVYSAAGLMAGAANIMTMYNRDITKVVVPATVSIFFNGVKPLLAT